MLELTEAPSARLSNMAAESHSTSSFSTLGSPENRQLSLTSEQTHNVQIGCGMPGCGLGPFIGRSDLIRHLKTHGKGGDIKTDGKAHKYVWECPTVGCASKGGHEYIKVHVSSSHHDNSVFRCKKCKGDFPRSVYAIHGLQLPFATTLANKRTCPLPKCMFTASTSPLSELDNLQQHLFYNHHLEGRTVFADLLEQTGYDARNCHVICPVCPSRARFPGHVEFSEHFMQAHFIGHACSVHGDDQCSEKCNGRKPGRRLIKCSSVPEQVRKARLSILRIWPDFEFYPVWEDVQCSGTI
jgi:hypothetical protein